MDNFVQKQGQVAVIVILLLALQFVTSFESLQKNPAIAQHTIANNNTNAISNLSKNNGHSESPQMTASGNNVYVVWLDDTLGSREIFLRRSTDGGNTFDSKIINLSKNNMEQGGGAFNPKITALANNVYVVWENIPDNNGQIFFSKSSDGGNTFSNPINLGNNTGFSGDPQIAVSKSNYVYVVWHNTGDGISFRRSTDGGNTFDKVINLSNNNSLSFQPQIAVSDKYDSYIYVIWRENHFYNVQNRQQLPRDDIIFRKSTDRGETFGDKSINLANNGSGTSAFLRLATSQSNVYALWTNVTLVPGNILTDIVFAKSFDNGNKFDKAANINNYTGWSFDPQLAVFGNNVYVVWNENPHGKNGDIMFRRSNNNGTTFENKITNLSNSTGENSFDHKIIVAQSQKNNVNDIYVAWNGDTTNGNKGTYLRSSINGGNTFDNVTNLSNNTDNNQSAASQISLSKSNNNLYIAWDTNTAANNEEIFFRQITAALMTTKTTIMNHSSLYDNNRPSIIRLKEIGSNNTIISENANNNNKDIGTTAASNIAIIDPTFTSAAYDNAFYLFYNLYANATSGTNITKHTGLLSNTITNETISNNAIIESSQAATDYLVSHIQWLMPKSNITVLGDEDVHNGDIFKKEDGNKNKYDVIILGHQEYVTQKEYDYLKKFVTNGGTLFLMDSNALYAEVKYDNKTNTVTMAKGHSWAFNGKSAWKNVGERWAKENSEWVGSNYLCYLCDIVFNNNPFKYIHREEQYITNPKDKILLDYNASIIGSHIIGSPNNVNNNSTMHYNVKNVSHHTGTKIKIATYQLDYGKGKVISLGIYTDDIIQNFNSHNSKFNKFRDTLLLNLNYKFNKFLDTLLLKYTPVGNKQ